MTDALRQTSFDRGVARELVLVLTASDNMAVYRCDAKNEAMKTISAHTKLTVHCESDWTVAELSFIFFSFFYLFVRLFLVLQFQQLVSRSQPNKRSCVGARC